MVRWTPKNNGRRGCARHTPAPKRVRRGVCAGNICGSRFYFGIILRQFQYPKYHRHSIHLAAGSRFKLRAEGSTAENGTGRARLEAKPRSAIAQSRPQAGVGYHSLAPPKVHNTLNAFIADNASPTRRIPIYRNPKSLRRIQISSILAMAPPGSGAQRSLSLTEELERLEQSITLTMQEIDSNFAKAHRIVATSILPIVERYAKNSEAVWEGSKVCYHVGVSTLKRFELTQTYSFGESSSRPRPTFPLMATNRPKSTIPL